MCLYKTPFTRAYWRDAAHSARQLKLFAFAALMIAAANVLSLITVPVTAYTQFSLGFLARSLCALVGGPILGLSYAFAEDILGFFLHPTGAFFPGYTLSTMAGVLIYALCFYRARITVVRLVSANVVVNLFVNAVMGSWWNVILRGNGFWFYFSTSFLKNLATLPAKVLMLYLFFQALLPVLERSKLIPKQTSVPIPIR